MCLGFQNGRNIFPLAVDGIMSTLHGQMALICQNRIRIIAKSLELHIKPREQVLTIRCVADVSMKLKKWQLLKSMMGYQVVHHIFQYCEVPRSHLLPSGTGVLKTYLWLKLAILSQYGLYRTTISSGLGPRPLAFGIYLCTNCGINKQKTEETSAGSPSKRSQKTSYFSKNTMRNDGQTSNAASFGTIEKYKF